MMKYAFETEGDDLRAELRERLERFNAMTDDERLVVLVNTGILNEDGTLADRYKAPEERKAV